MEIAKIIPIFKNGQKTEFTNYRPISILSQFSKILEKLLNLILDANKILSDSQYGFRPGMSTVHAAAQLVEQIRFSRTASMVSDLVCPRSTQLLNLLNK